MTNPDSRFEVVRELFEDLRPRSPEGRVITAVDALAITGIGLAVVAEERFMVRQRLKREPFATIGITLAAGSAIRSIVDNGVVGALHQIGRGPSL